MTDKYKDLVQELVDAVGDCEDTDIVLDIAKRATEIFNQEKKKEETEYFDKELEVLHISLLRATTAIEYIRAKLND